MAKEKIIITDDEPGIRQLVKIFLTRYHFEVIEAASGLELLNILETTQPDLIILDLMLPDMYGLDVCKKIREKLDTPIIMLTAVQGEMNVVLGFEAGADDYVEKPFSPHVLLSRIQAILRRRKTQPVANSSNQSFIETMEDLPSHNENYHKASFAQWSYIPEEACLKHQNGKHIFLTKNECLLLELFLAFEQEILSREKIASVLKIDIDDPESRAIDVQISRLRNKLKDRTHHNLIKSIRNKGYLLSVPVRFFH
ncbi:MAG: two component transcriptional regulator, winged helix family [Gammaproteobacteria bacterium]|jgi:DNA-binding response OmpR family regulator|nr:two component transcriptional regulator, winged helix family [Gammaproteobacteria bacterium]